MVMRNALVVCGLALTASTCCADKEALALWLKQPEPSVLLHGDTPRIDFLREDLFEREGVFPMKLLVTKRTEAGELQWRTLPLRCKSTTSADFERVASSQPLMEVIDGFTKKTFFAPATWTLCVKERVDLAAEFLSLLPVFRSSTVKGLIGPIAKPPMSDGTGYDNVSYFSDEGALFVAFRPEPSPSGTGARRPKPPAASTADHKSGHR